MLKKIKIKGFRSIRDQEINLAPLTVIYGPTASGKSSLLYSLLVIKNFISNPNQQVDSFFSFGFIDLGGFDACVFNHNPDGKIEISFDIEEGKYGCIFQKNKGEIYLNSTNGINIKLKINFPYLLNQNFSSEWRENEQKYTINWNGIASSVVPKQPTAETQQRAFEISAQLNTIPETIKNIDIVPPRRGFFKPLYTPSKISLHPTTEDEVASIIINDPNLPPRISVDLERILERDFRLYIPPGTSTVYFQTTDKGSRVPGYLVNDGFGVNQIVYLLAKIHRAEIKTILIEEPEIHLHPKMIRALVKVLCQIIKEEQKQIVLVTHSEVFVSSILAAVAEKTISPEDLLCYLVLKENKETVLSPQKVEENGQIEGGLSSFMEGELEDLKALLGLNR